MKLVERVLDNIPSEEISEIAAEFNMPAVNISSVMNAIIPGILSAFKAKLVSGMNTGDVSSLLGMFESTQSNFDINQLFNDNTEALNTLYGRISEFSGIDEQKISEIVPAIMPTISNAVSNMLQDFGASTLIAQGNNFITDLVSTNAGYETAINAANDFLGSVFGMETKKELSIPASSAELNEHDSFVQNLFDLFDQDNDGSVMDDIYRMLVK